VAEPKREEDGIFPLDGGREEREDGSMSFSGDDSTSMDPPPGRGGALGGDVTPAAEVAKLRAEKDDLLQTLVRRQADFENYRKRTERDRTEEGRRGVERMLMDLIPVLDAFDRALQSHNGPVHEEYHKGITLIRKQLSDVLTRHGVQRIDAAGKMFDPHVHQAIERVESKESPDGFIVDVFQDGYLFHGRVLRPAIVRVVVNAGEAPNSQTTEDEDN
jgi:molecular chaperone GrpE